MNCTLNSLGEFLASEILTVEDRIVGYVKEFRSFPYRAGKDGKIHYQASGDEYLIINSNWGDVEMVNGQLVFK